LILNIQHVKEVFSNCKNYSNWTRFLGCCGQRPICISVSTIKNIIWEIKLERILKRKNLNFMGLDWSKYKQYFFRSRGDTYRKLSHVQWLLRFKIKLWRSEMTVKLDNLTQKRRRKNWGSFLFHENIFYLYQWEQRNIRFNIRIQKCFRLNFLMSW